MRLLQHCSVLMEFFHGRLLLPIALPCVSFLFSTFLSLLSRHRDSLVLPPAGKCPPTILARVVLSMKVAVLFYRIILVPRIMLGSWLRDQTRRGRRMEALPSLAMFADTTP
jgi:hypothetical protein